MTTEVQPVQPLHQIVLALERMVAQNDAALARDASLPDTQDRLVAAFERIATAMEQNVLERIDHAANATAADPYPSDLPFPTDEVVDLPPVRPSQPVYQPPPTRIATPQTQACPVHNTPWKLIPAGTSKKTGNAYTAFWACSTAGCNQRPSL